MPLINSEINLILIWSVKCVIISSNVANQGANFQKMIQNLMFQ